MPNYYYDKDRNVQPAGGSQGYMARIRITQDAWDKADEDVRQQVSQILAVDPIPLLGLGGHGKGIKAESDGWTFHTQTNKRLYDKNREHLKKANKDFEFDAYAKSPH